MRILNEIKPAGRKVVFMKQCGHLFRYLFTQAVQAR